MEARVKKVIASLEIDSQDDDVRVVGIKGMGGAGKTTLAEAVYYEMAIFFEAKSFVHNVRERSKSPGLRELQKQVLSDVLKDKHVVDHILVGKQEMMNKMPGRKVLLVLDDVDNLEQLQSLADDPAWFKAGSRIIITTRDDHVLTAHGNKFKVNVTHDVSKSLLSGEEAICLFSKYAFGRDNPDQEYEQLSKEVADYAAGLPLTLRVLGSDLCGRPKNEWKDFIRRLKKFPEEKTVEILELSYSSLKNDEKEIFLDIACILKGERVDVARRILDSCGFDAGIGIPVLGEKSLITISNDGHLILHDLIAEMGRNIVCREDPRDPERRSRLWNKEEIESILEDDLGTHHIRCIKLLNTQLNPDTILKGLKNMKKLRFIHVDNDGYKPVEHVSPDGLPNALKSLYWRNYPFRCLPRTFRGKMLVNLEMVGSKICQLWEEGEKKDLEELKFVDLRNSYLKTFDLGTTPSLETLNLKGCKDFETLHMPVACEKLKYLNLGGSKVKNLNFEMTPRLQKLTLSIKEICQLPDSICELGYLESLKLESCLLLKELPDDLGRLRKLKKLVVERGRRLKEIPSSICEIKCLEYLHLPYAGVRKWPEQLGNLTSLKELNLEGTSMSEIPRSVLEIKGLLIVGDRERLESYGLTSLTLLTQYTASCYV